MVVGSAVPTWGVPLHGMPESGSHKGPLLPRFEGALLDHPLLVSAVHIEPQVLRAQGCGSAWPQTAVVVKNLVRGQASLAGVARPQLGVVVP